MNRLASMRVGAVVVSLAMALAGCDCGKVDCARTPADPKCVCDNSDLTVAFVAPMEGAMVDQTSNVQVSLSRKGMPVNIGTARLEVRGPGATDFSDKGNGTADGATATFTGVMLAAGENALRATVAEVNCSGSANPKTIVVTAKSMVTPPPVIVSCTFPQDSNGDGTLNAAELPAGTQVSVRVLTTNGAGATFSAPGSNPAMAPIMNETATIAVPGPTADGTFSVTGTVARGTGMPTCSPMIRVQRTAGCAVENTTSQAPRGPMDDADGATAGFQVRATARRLSGMVAAANFRLGTQTASASFAAGMDDVSALFTVSSSGTQMYSVGLEAKDAAGNDCTVTNGTRTFTVDFDAPQVSITSPAALPDGGSVLVTSSPLTVTATSTDAVNGCLFRVSGMTRTQVDCASFANGVVRLQVPFAMDGSYVLIVEGTDGAGNVGSARVDVLVTNPGCGILFTRPSNNPALITGATAPSGIYAFQTQSKVVCAGQDARLLRASVSGDGGIGSFSVASNATLQAQAASDGGVGAAIANFNVPVSSGQWLFRAEVTNLADAGIDSAELDATVDLDGPSITNPVLSGSATQVVVGAVSDGDLVTPGVQRILTFNARVPVGGRVDVCTTQALDPVTMTQRSQTPACGTGWFQLQQGVVSPASGFTFPNGTYSIKVVVVSGGTFIESPAVPLLVDGVAPCLSAGSLRLPQDTNPMDFRLNAVELGAAAPRLEFTLNPACLDTDFSTLSATVPVVVRTVVGGIPQAPVSVNADVMLSAGVVSVALSQPLVDEQNYSFFVDLTDRAGNKNVYTGLSDPASISVRIDRTPPACSLVSPSATTLNLVDTPSGNLSVTIGTATDVGTNGVSVSLTGPATLSQTGTPAGPSNQASVTLMGITGAATWSLSATCRDQSGNLGTLSARNIVIDRVAPTCTFTSPVVGTTMQYSELSIQTTLTVTDADMRMVSISSSVGGPRGSLTVSGTTATGLLSYQNGTQDVTATLTDSSGNPGTCSVTGVVVNSSNCQLAMTNGFANANGTWFNRSNTGSLTATTGVISPTAQTTNCSTGRAASLRRTGPTVGTPVAGMTDGSGNVSFPNVAVNDGETWRIEVVNGGAAAPSTADFRVDLDLPTLSSVRIANNVRANASNNFLVAATSNRNVETTVAGYFADNDSVAANGQVDLGVDNIQVVDFGLPGSLRVLFKGGPVANRAMMMNGTTVDFAGPVDRVTLPHNDTGQLAVELVDAAGNASSWTATMTVDVVAPNAPAVVPSFATPNVSNRRGEVTLSWVPTGDDGDVSTGGHAGYEIRWTTDSVLPTGNKLANPTDYFGSSSRSESDVPWTSSNPTTRVVSLPPLNTYYIAVRAKDEVGNYATYVAPPASGFTNFWTPVALTGPAASAFGRSLATEGSLDSDNIPEIVVGAPSRNASNGSVFIYSGNATLADQTTCAAGCQEIAPADTVGREFGWDVSTAGNVGDVAGEGKNDLLVAQRGSASVVGRAFLYFGTTSSTISTSAGTFILFRGDLATDRFASAAKIIKSIDGDSLDEVMINAHNGNGGRGRVFVFRGRSRAAWITASTGVEVGTGAAFVPTSAADWVFEGPADIPLPSSGVAFGLERFGMGDVGDFNGDGRNDFVIPAGLDSIGRVQLYSGAQVSPDGGSFPSNPIPTTAAFTTLQGTTTASNSVDGFGTRTVGSQNLLNGTGQDLVIARPAQSSVFIYADFAPVGVAGCVANSGTPCVSSASLTLTGANGFGAHFSVGNLNRDTTSGSLPLNDLVVAEGLTASNRSWVLYQQANAYPSPVGTGAPQFWVSLFSGTALGRTTAISDVTGDTNPDLILGDYLANSIRIWR